MKVLLAKLICSAIVGTSATGEAPVNDRGLAVACEYSYDLVEAAFDNDIDPFVLAGLVWVESRWQPEAVSYANACGLTQVLPKYAKETCEELKQPPISLRVGAEKLKIWNRRGKGLEGGLACYNVGNRCATSPRGRRYSRWVRAKAKQYRAEAQRVLQETNQQCLPLSEVVAAAENEWHYVPERQYYSAGKDPVSTPATVRML